MSAFGFRPNPFFIAEAEASLVAAEGISAVLEEMKAFAESIAPVETGEYRDSFETDIGIENGKLRGQLINTSDHAAFVEFGTVDTPVFAVMHKAGEKFGQLEGGE